MSRILHSYSLQNYWMRLSLSLRKAFRAPPVSSALKVALSPGDLSLIYLLSFLAIVLANSTQRNNHCIVLYFSELRQTNIKAHKNIHLCLQELASVRIRSVRRTRCQYPDQQWKSWKRLMGSLSIRV